MDEVTTEQMIAEVQAEPAPSAEPAQEQAAPQQTPAEYEYAANGKTIKEPLDVILKRASQGYNYAQHMNDLKLKQQEVDTNYQEALKLKEKYGEIDQYARDNPEWHDHLHKSWEARFDITGKSDQALEQTQQNGIPSQFLQEFNEMKSFVENIKAERADQAYNTTFNRVKESYPDIDFTHTDPESGKSLEQQVLEYAQQNSIGSFEPAFKAFYSDQLVERARNEAKNQLAQDIQKRNKAGLLGTSQAPSRSSNEWEYPSNYKNMSMDQLTNFLVDKFAN